MIKLNGNNQIDNTGINLTDVTNGIIVESGSNANGNYIKFNEGTMICYGLITIPASTDGYTLTFPQSYINSNSYVITVTNIYYNSPNIVVTVGSRNANNIKVYPRGITSGSVPSNISAIFYVAIGKWK